MEINLGTVTTENESDLTPNGTTCSNCLKVLRGAWLHLPTSKYDPPAHACKVVLDRKKRMKQKAVTPTTYSAAVRALAEWCHQHKQYKVFFYCQLLDVIQLWQLVVMQPMP